MAYTVEQLANLDLSARNACGECGAEANRLLGRFCSRCWAKRIHERTAPADLARLKSALNDRPSPLGHPCGACGETNDVRVAYANRWRCAGCRERVPLSLADVEHIARLAIAQVMRDALGPGDHDASGVRVVVDSQSEPGMNVPFRWRVWLERGHASVTTTVSTLDSEAVALETLTEDAFELLAQVGASVVARGGR